jgi:hypothetical protein
MSPGMFFEEEEAISELASDALRNETSERNLSRRTLVVQDGTALKANPTQSPILVNYWLKSTSSYCTTAKIFTITLKIKEIQKAKIRKFKTHSS